MSVTIRPGFMATIKSPGWGDKEIFAETLPGLDAEVEAYLNRLLEVRERRSAAILARTAGVQRAAYRAAREAMKLRAGE